MPTEELLSLIIPYWQEAGYEFDAETDKSWLLQLTSLIAPSLTRLTDAVKESTLFFAESITITDEAMDLLKQEGVKEVLTSISEEITADLSEADAKDIIKKVTKAQKVKKGLIMRSLRASLTGELHGPDLIQTWLLLNQKGIDKTRVQLALNQI
jgi:glutamyl-tRNA synthetase